jgi:hypothetical protein
MISSFRGFWIAVALGSGVGNIVGNAVGDGTIVVVGCAVASLETSTVTVGGPAVTAGGVVGTEVGFSMSDASSSEGNSPFSDVRHEARINEARIQNNQ